MDEKEIPLVLLEEFKGRGNVFEREKIMACWLNRQSDGWTDGRTQPLKEIRRRI